jgi:hypothetical protein
MAIRRHCRKEMEMIIQNSLRALLPISLPKSSRDTFNKSRNGWLRRHGLAGPAYHTLLSSWTSVYDPNKCGLISNHILTLLLLTSYFPSCAFPKTMSRNSSRILRNIFTTSSTITKKFPHRMLLQRISWSH